MLSRGQEVFQLDEILHLLGGMDPWSILELTLEEWVGICYKEEEEEGLAAYAESWRAL